MPLRVALVVPFVLQISAAVGLTAFLSLKNGQKAVNEVATQLRNEVTVRIHQHVTDYISNSHYENNYCYHVMLCKNSS